MTCEELRVECGPISDGCEVTLNCGTCSTATSRRCEFGRCVCIPDSGEPGNDGRTGLMVATTLDDSITMPPFSVTGSLHNEFDLDWTRVAIVDGPDGGSPVLAVELVGAPAGSDYEISAYFTCGDSAATNATSCRVGVNDDTVGQGCTSLGLVRDMVELDTSCGGALASEDGTLWVSVRAVGWADTCGEYQFTVSAR